MRARTPQPMRPRPSFPSQVFPWQVLLTRVHSINWQVIPGHAWTRKIVKGKKLSIDAAHTEQIKLVEENLRRKLKLVRCTHEQVKLPRNLSRKHWQVLHRNGFFEVNNEAALNLGFQSSSQPSHSNEFNYFNNFYTQRINSAWRRPHTAKPGRNCLE